MGKSKINLGNVFKKHWSTLEEQEGKIKWKDKVVLIWLPLLLAIGLSYLTKGEIKDALSNIYAVTLSIFIGLFLNLLVLILSVSQKKEPKDNRDMNNLGALLKESFYNTSYTLLTSVASLVLLIIVLLLPDTKDLAITHYYSLLKLFVVAFFYFVFIGVFSSLLVIVRRVFCLFEDELESDDS
ncbi:hypothetical protein FUAX_33140 [Fulvitalea axinellae]|uniref:Uncharacterized protein n=1 Tax=Fulvitalea axinellae TaxID=1182444 RepID=A0AAU9CZI2_9BACT|nr:hypothetical protein FUAX_33140 [Fulvitalea axinellae]